MRKSVLFLLGVLYLVSVVVVTFFGIQARMDQFKVYISHLEITNYQGTFDLGGQKVKYASITKKTESVSFCVETRIEPSNATNKKLEYVLFKPNGELLDSSGIVVTSDGIVEFHETKDVILKIKTTDGSALQESIMIFCSQ
jgi:hypothetical protein